MTRAFDAGQAGANGQQPRRLLFASHKHNFRSGVIDDVRDALGRLPEVDRHDHGAEAGDRKISYVPFGAVRREDGDAVAVAGAHFGERSRKAGDASEHFPRGDVLPLVADFVNLRS